MELSSHVHAVLAHLLDFDLIQSAHVGKACLVILQYSCPDLSEGALSVMNT